MSRVAVISEGLSKRYRIGGPTESYGRLTETLSQAVRRPFRRSRGDDHIWALNDVSLEVAEGEVVGIIGRNGAGKTTLLKILSRITSPTKGRAELRGRVGSLLEVGTGFHPELTGRENVFLNGAVLGMSRSEISRKFDEIVSFSEVEKFLDTPVKRYSSGMQVRLAFAVAAHLEPEILIVDEVLAVGDAAFQKKCLGKMQDVSTQGRTVLFVSHNMAPILSLCPRTLLLEGGRKLLDGATSEVVKAYLQSGVDPSTHELALRDDRTGDGVFRLTSLEIESLAPDGVVRPRSGLRVRLSYEGQQPLRFANFMVGVYDLTNVGAFLLSSEVAGGLPEELPPKGSVVCHTDPISLTPGRCYVNVALQRGGVMSDYVQGAAFFDVEPEDVYGTGRMPSRDWVIMALGQRWEVLDGT